MIVLRKYYKDDVRENSLLLLSTAIVAMAFVMLYQEMRDISISSSRAPQPTVKKSAISVVMRQAAPTPIVAKPIESVVPKPIVKKPVVKKEQPKPVVKKEQPKPVQKPIEKAIQKPLLQEVVAVEEQPQESPLIKQSEVAAQPTPQEATPQEQEAVAQQESIPFDAEIKEEYMAGLYRVLSMNKHYPKMAKRRHLEGVAHIHFRLQKNGRLTDISLHKGCKHRSLNKAALKLVRGIESYKPIPDEVSRVAMNIKIPITYSLKESY